MWTTLLVNSGLFAATDAFGRLPPWLQGVIWLVGVVALIAVPVYVGKAIARASRLPQMWWRVALILFSLLAGTAIVGLGWPPRYGVDLNGGVILVYQVESGATMGGESVAQNNGQNPVTNELIEALKRRLNPDGLKEIVIRPFGTQQVEIIVPDVEGVEISEIKRNISTAGELRFRIMAEPAKHPQIVAAARAQLQDPQLRLMDEVRLDQQVVARWTRVGREDQERGGIRPLRMDVSSDVIRDARTGELIENIPPTARNSEANPTAFDKWLVSQDIEGVEVLMIEPTQEVMDVRGDQLSIVRSDYDETLSPAVSFNMTTEGATRMAALTTAHLPDKDTDFHYRLGIVLDNQLLSAPRIMTTIMDRGRITGRFTQEEVNFLVSILRAGRLPAVLNKEPISQNIIGPVLGLETIQKGGWSIFWSLIVVLLFVCFYYKWAGLIACMALLLNLLLTLALLILFSASLTLPGLAGLVLTVGMSVDANVLIYERIREELARGATLRMAIRNGFARATTAIVDSNLTTFITAVVLYVIGTDQIRGYAITLALGILMCMYTAVFCSRVIFEIGERNGWIKQLNMRHLIGSTNIDFLSMRRPAIVVSLIVIAIGLGATFMRGSNMLDIDFSGGTSVVMNLKEPLSDAEVRQKLDTVFADLRLDNDSLAQYTLNRIDVQERTPGTVWKIDSSINSIDRLQSVVRETFPLTTYSVDVGPLQENRNVIPAVEPAGGAAVPSEGAGEPGSEGAAAPSGGAGEPGSEGAAVPSEEAGEPGSEGAAVPSGGAGEPGSEGAGEPVNETEEGSGCGFQPEPVAEETTEEPAAEEPAAEEPVAEEAAAVDEAVAEDAAAQAAGDGQPAPASEQPEVTETPAAETPASEAPTSAEQPSAEQPAGSAAPASRSVRVTTTTQLNFADEIDKETLEQLIGEIADELELGDVSVTLIPAQEDLSGANASDQWKLTLGVAEPQARSILGRLETAIDTMPVWEQASEIGSKVADDTKEKAVAAMVISILGIIAYIWLRFQKVAFGLAAVAALVHDVLITLGAIAVSYFVARGLSFLLIDEFKINLTVIAAFLTIIGYSLNDTIVIFDRIREVRGKSPELTGEMINLSVNQTLSRTILTSLTTMLVVFILYVFGGQGIHDFAFSLLIGMFAGVYSTVFIASPVLLWMVHGRSTAKR